MHGPVIIVPKKKQNKQIHLHYTLLLSIHHSGTYPHQTLTLCKFMAIESKKILHQSKARRLQSSYKQPSIGFHNNPYKLRLEIAKHKYQNGRACSTLKRFKHCCLLDILYVGSFTTTT